LFLSVFTEIGQFPQKIKFQSSACFCYKTTNSADRLKVAQAAENLFLIMRCQVIRTCISVNKQAWLMHWTEGNTNSSGIYHQSTLDDNNNNIIVIITNRWRTPMNT